MRFARRSRVEPYVETSRKRQAVLISQRRSRGRLPLHAPLIATQQPTADEVMPSRADSWPAWQHQRRNERATDWRRARSSLWSLAPSLRVTIRSLWNEAPYPADPGYLLDFLRTGGRNKKRYRKPLVPQGAGPRHARLRLCVVPVPRGTWPAPLLSCASVRSREG
jgi:hypothetical protein